MTFLDVLRTALSGISANKLRTGLTMLGIIIGVASVIATLALGNGARAAVENSFRFLGSDQIQVGAEFKIEDGESRPAGKLLTYEDGLTLADAAPLIDRVEMTVRGTGKVRHGQTTLDMPFTGVDAGALTGKIAGGKVQPVGWPAGDMLTSEAFLASGRFFTHSEVAAGAQVCVLGYRTADDLFLGDDPIGQTVWINRKPCEVIGVVAELETVDQQERTRGHFGRPAAGGAHFLLPAGGDGGRVAGGRRHRHHERDAGQRHRADAGDWRAPGRRGAAAGAGLALLDPASIPVALAGGSGDGHHLWAVSRNAGSASRPNRGATI
jgi:hypothetical protein